MKNVDLINNLWRMIFSMVDYESLLSVSCVNKRFNSLCQNKEIHKNVVEKVEKDSKMIELLNYAEKFVSNPWKPFLILQTKSGQHFIGESNKTWGNENYEIKIVEDPSLVNNLTKYYLTNGVYTFWRISKAEKGVYFLLFKLMEEESEPTNWTIRHGAGYYDEFNKLLTKEGLK